jgi:hypothetical protein
MWKIRVSKKTSALSDDHTSSERYKKIKKASMLADEQILL